MKINGKEKKKKRTSKNRKILSTEEKAKLKEEQSKKRKARQFKNKIKNIFIIAGFAFLNTSDKHIKIGLRTVEIDSVFFYENIILICEDTGTSTKNIKEHVRNKSEAFDEIKKNFKDFYKWISDTFEEKRDIFCKYAPDQYQIFNMYFSQENLGFSIDDYRLYSNIKFVEPQALNYFYRMMQCIKKSVKYEIFRFLQLKNEEIGVTSTESDQKTIKATIISPKEGTGIKNGVRIVSFMMSADTLIKNAYVLRKDNWDDSVWLYQRLIQKDKIKRIREFLIKKKEAFYNNIIVGLPDDIYFRNKSGNIVNINQVGNYDVCDMILPDKMNSICVIDGQHRIYAHYEGLDNDKNEAEIAELRQKLHLLVTGLVFPKEMSMIERAKIQSEIFLDINYNAKPVSADVLLHIQMVKDPLSDVGLARRVIERLNKESIFLNKFEMSSLDEGKIKIASIIKFALRYLVTMKPSDERLSFYSYWDGDKVAFEKMNDGAIMEYIEYCTKNLSQYFSAIKNRFRDDWNNPDSKILSVVSINGFIIAYNKFINNNGIKDYRYFNGCLERLNIDFSEEKFPYTSSQYGKFSEQILNEALLNSEEVTKLLAATSE